MRPVFLALALVAPAVHAFVPAGAVLRPRDCRSRGRGLRSAVDGPAAPPADEDRWAVRRARLRQSLPKGDGLDDRIGAVLWPSTLNFLVVPCVSAVDTLWVGRMGSALALAGQGAAISVFETVFFIATFLPTVAAPLIAKAIAEGKDEEARERVGDTMFLATAVGLACTAVLSGFPRTCLRLTLPASSAAAASGAQYLRARSLSLVPALWATVGFAAFRGLLDGKTPLRISLFSNGINAVLDPLLIFRAGLGVTGAAAATAVAEVAGGAAHVAMLSRKKLLNLRQAMTPPPASRLWPLLTSGAVLQLRNLALNGAFMYATRVAQLTDPTGVQAAAYSITMQYWLLGGVALLALQATAATLVPSERARAAPADADLVARDTSDRLMTWGLLVGAGLAVVQVASLPLLGVFSPLPAVQKATVRPALIASAMQLMNGPVFAGEGILMGLGSFSALAWQTVIGAVFMVGGLKLSAVRGYGLDGIWVAIGAFNLVQLVGCGRHIYFSGPLSRGRIAVASGDCAPDPQRGELECLVVPAAASAEVNDGA